VSEGPLPDPAAVARGPANPWQKVRRSAIRSKGRAYRAYLFRTDESYRKRAGSYELPDGSRRVYLHHIRKTAGTSLYLSFLALGGEEPMAVWRRISADPLARTVSGRYSFAANNAKVLAEGAYFFGRSHHPATSLDLPPKTYTVTVLRDPVDRVHSYFDYLVAGDDPGLPGRVALHERRMAFDGFDAFLDRVPNHDLLTQVSMFSERCDVAEAADRIASCSFVFQTSDFATGLEELGRRLLLPLEVHRIRVTSTRSTLTDAQRERLRSRLEPEYELLRTLEQGGVLSAGPSSTD
jgi:hypothetical protein